MVLPHSKSGNEPLESTLPPTRYFYGGYGMS